MGEQVEGRVPRQFAKFVPPDGDASQPIQVMGFQNYSSDAPSRCDAWIFYVPPKYLDHIPDQYEVDTLAEVRRVLSDAFLGGDERSFDKCWSSDPVGPG